jgi:hypothetical protein
MSQQMRIKIMKARSRGIDCPAVSWDFRVREGHKPADHVNKGTVGAWQAKLDRVLYDKRQLAPAHKVPSCPKKYERIKKSQFNSLRLK